MNPGPILGDSAVEEFANKHNSGRVGMALATLAPTAVAAMVEVAVLYAFASGWVGWHIFVMTHLVVIAGLAAWTIWISRQDRDGTVALLVTVSIAAAGPIGALAAAAALVLTMRQQEDPKLLADWYHRIAMAVETDEVTRLCEQVISGRTSDLGGRPPASFATVMERGTLDDRQAALGIIARNFHPDYLAVLMMALKSPEPVIRVQAAAVATRVRGDLHSLVDRHALTSETIAAGSSGALTAATHLDAAITSGLLDEGDRIRAGVIVSRLRNTPANAITQPIRLKPIPLLERAPAETTLLHAGRFAEFRVARRIAAIADAGAYRVRRARRRVATRAN